MPKRYVISFLGTLLITISFETYGFSWKECSNQGLGSGHLFGLSTSSGQFTSSTGGCSALASKDQILQEFYVTNFDKIKTDFARGGGEHASILFFLSSCSAYESEMALNRFRTELPSLSFDFAEKSYLKTTGILKHTCI